jgi:hypothetical protein
VHNIKLDLGEIGRGGMEWMGLLQDRDQWRAFSNMVFNFWFQEKLENSSVAAPSQEELISIELVSLFAIERTITYISLVVIYAIRNGKNKTNNLSLVNMFSYFSEFCGVW